MKKLFFILVAAIFSVSAMASESSYKLDDSKVDAIFASASEMTISSDMSLSNDFAGSMAMVSSGASNTGTIAIAWVVDWFLGGFGVHRYILGTKGSMWAIYTFTVCGIFGIVPTIDWFVLLIDGLILGNGDKYMDNEKFFMWG